MRYLSSLPTAHDYSSWGPRNHLWEQWTVHHVWRPGNLLCGYYRRILGRAPCFSRWFRSKDYDLFQLQCNDITNNTLDPIIFTREKRKRSDAALWQKILHQQKCQKGKVTTQTTPQKIDYTAIADRLRTASCSNYSLSACVVYRFYRTHFPNHRNSCEIEGKNKQILLFNDVEVLYKFII